MITLKFAKIIDEIMQIRFHLVQAQLSPPLWGLLIDFPCCSGPFGDLLRFFHNSQVK